MNFAVLLHPKAAKALKSLEKSLKSRIIRRLKELENHPKAGKRLKYSNFWSLRVGDYRVIYEIYTDEKKVIILFIGHRKKVYDDFSKIF